MEYTRPLRNGASNCGANDDPIVMGTVMKNGFEKYHAWSPTGGDEPLTRPSTAFYQNQEWQSFPTTRVCYPDSSKTILKQLNAFPQTF